VREVWPIVFLLSKFSCFSCFSGSHHDLETSFNLNGYFSFTSTTLDSVNVKISGNLKQKLFLGIFFQNPSQYYTNWLSFENLATKVTLNQTQKYFEYDLLLGPKPIL
jgi:hypothetical protein